MRRKARDFEVFSLSFLDVISCGFGAVVLLVLISPFGESVLPDFTSRSESLLNDVLAAQARVTALEQALLQETRSLEDMQERLTRESAQAEQAQASLRTAQGQADSLREDVAGLEQVEK